MLSWRRLVFVAVALATAKGVLALLAADEPQSAPVVPLLNSELRIPSSENSSEPDASLAPGPTRVLQPPIADPPEVFTPSPEFQEWITRLVREQLPDNYEKRKNWGHTAKSFDGVSVRLEGGNLKTHRKFREANDGKWQLYRIKLTDPDEKLDVKIAKIRRLPDGKVGLEITAVATLEAFGRQSLWQHGVQLYSVSAEATARVRLWAHAEVATHLDVTRFPPDISLDPKITAAKFEIPDFRLRRVGELHGPLVRSLSHATREALEEKLAEDNAKLVAKLNRAIDKQEKKLKLSFADVMQSRWSGLVGEASKPEPPVSNPSQ
jgi:hypothetical protein